MRRILLSASFPESSRADAIGPHSTQDIGLAAAATVEAILTRGMRLVFGGHPSISPVVLNLAALIQGDAGVTIYQSDFFADQITHEVKRLEDLEGVEVVSTPKIGDRVASMELLREQMLSEELAAAFFVGGMQGVEDEFDALGQRSPAPRFLFTTPGGRAALLVERLLAGPPDEKSPVQECGDGVIALNGRGYAHLAMRALDLVS